MEGGSEYEASPIEPTSNGVSGCIGCPHEVKKGFPGVLDPCCSRMGLSRKLNWIVRNSNKQECDGLLLRCSHCSRSPSPTITENYCSRERCTMRTCEGHGGWSSAKVCALVVVVVVSVRSRSELMLAGFIVRRL